MKRKHVATAYAASVALEKLGINNEQMDIADSAIDLFMQRKYKDALELIDHLQFNTQRGLMLTPFCFVVRNSIKAEIEQNNEIRA